MRLSELPPPCPTRGEVYTGSEIGRSSGVPHLGISLLWLLLGVTDVTWDPMKDVRG